MASVQSDSYEGRYLKLTVVEESYSVANNTSTVRWTFESIGGTGSYYTINNWGVWVNNQEIYPTQTTGYNTKNFPAAKGSTTGTITINHNADGSASDVPFTLKGKVYYSGTEQHDGTCPLTQIPTKYVYYNQGNASSNTNLPATQSARQGASLTLATNRMTRNSANTTTNTITFNVEGTNRGTRNCYINTSYSANGWATSASGAFAYANGQSVTMGSNNITLYPYFTPSDTQVKLTLPSLADLGVTVTNKELEGWYSNSSFTNKIGNAGDSVYLQTQTVYAKLVKISNIKYNPNNTGFTTKNMYLSVNGGNFNLITVDKIKKL